MKLKLSSKTIWVPVVLLAGMCAVILALRLFYAVPKLEPLHSKAASPLYEAGDKVMTIYMKAVAVEDGKLVNQSATIHESKDRVNQMKQALLAYLDGPRVGKVQVPVPEGAALNEVYLTPTGSAVVDLSLDQVKKEKVGFYEEFLFIRCLIDTLTGNFFEIKQVKILEDGQDLPTLFGHYALSTSDAAMPVTTTSGAQF